MPEGLSPQERIDLGPDSSWRGDSDNQEMLRLHEKVRKMIMAHPYFEAAEVKALLGTDDVEALVDNGTLLAYKDHDDLLFPAFQFDPDTNRPSEVISQVNIILDAPNDGWGVTGWWVQSSGWLGENTAPKDLLRSPSEYALLELAKAVVADDTY